MQKLKQLLILLVGVLLLTSFIKPRKKDLWQELATIQQLAAVEKKPILIDIYTDWCIYCKKMDVGVYRNDSVYNFLKQNYYRWKFNAERKDSLIWNNIKYGYNKRYNVHDLAGYFTQGYLSYPTTVIIPVDGVPFYLAGELKTKEIEPLLKYFLQNKTSQGLEQYIRNFQTTWK